MLSFEPPSIYSVAECIKRGNRPKLWMREHFPDGSAETAVVLKLLGAIVNREARFTTYEFVIGALVGILEAAPTADVVDENGFEVG